MAATLNLIAVLLRVLAATARRHLRPSLPSGVGARTPQRRSCARQTWGRDSADVRGFPEVIDPRLAN